MSDTTTDDVLNENATLRAELQTLREKERQGRRDYQVLLGEYNAAGKAVNSLHKKVAWLQDRRPTMSTVGRPRMKEGEARNKMIRIRVNEAEMETIFNAAAVVGPPGMSDWARDTLLDAADRLLSPPLTPEPGEVA